MSLTENAPYTISFLPDAPPSKVNNTKRDPGPPDGKRRAGYTSYVVAAKLTVAVAGGSVGADSLRPFFFETVTVEFFLKDFSVEVSSDYRVDSCPFRVTCEHEFESHVRRPTRLFLDNRDVVVRRFNQIPLPTKQVPRKIHQGQEDTTQALLIRPVTAAVKELKALIKTVLEKDGHEQDSAAAYHKVYARCRAEEWGSREF